MPTLGPYFLILPPQPTLRCLRMQFNADDTLQTIESTPVEALTKNNAWTTHPSTETKFTLYDPEKKTHNCIIFKNGKPYLFPLKQISEEKWLKAVTHDETLKQTPSDDTPSKLKPLTRERYPNRGLVFQKGDWEPENIPYESLGITLDDNPLIDATLTNHHSHWNKIYNNYRIANPIRDWNSEKRISIDYLSVPSSLAWYQKNDVNAYFIFWIENLKLATTNQADYVNALSAVISGTLGKLAKMDIEVQKCAINLFIKLAADEIDECLTESFYREPNDKDSQSVSIDDVNMYMIALLQAEMQHNGYTQMSAAWLYGDAFLSKVRKFKKDTPYTALFKAMAHHGYSEALETLVYPITHKPLESYPCLTVCRLITLLQSCMTNPELMNRFAYFHHDETASEAINKINNHVALLIDLKEKKSLIYNWLGTWNLRQIKVLLTTQPNNLIVLMGGLDQYVTRDLIKVVKEYLPSVVNNINLVQLFDVLCNEQVHIVMREIVEIKMEIGVVGVRPLEMLIELLNATPEDMIGPLLDAVGEERLDAILCNSSCLEEFILKCIRPYFILGQLQAKIIKRCDYNYSMSLISSCESEGDISALTKLMLPLLDEKIINYKILSCALQDVYKVVDEKRFHAFIVELSPILQRILFDGEQYRLTFTEMGRSIITSIVTHLPLPILNVITEDKQLLRAIRELNPYAMTEVLMQIKKRIPTISLLNTPEKLRALFDGFKFWLEGAHYYGRERIYNDEIKPRLEGLIKFMHPIDLAIIIKEDGSGLNELFDYIQPGYIYAIISILYRIFPELFHPILTRLTNTINKLPWQVVLRALLYSDRFNDYINTLTTEQLKVFLPKAESFIENYTPDKIRLDEDDNDKPLFAIKYWSERLIEYVKISGPEKRAVILQYINSNLLAKIRATLFPILAAHLSLAELSAMLKNMIPYAGNGLTTMFQYEVIFWMATLRRLKENECQEKLTVLFDAVIPAKQMGTLVLREIKKNSRQGEMTLFVSAIFKYVCARGDEIEELKLNYSKLASWNSADAFPALIDNIILIYKNYVHSRAGALATKFWYHRPHRMPALELIHHLESIKLQKPSDNNSQNQLNALCETLAISYITAKSEHRSSHPFENDSFVKRFKLAAHWITTYNHYLQTRAIPTNPTIAYSHS